MLWNVTKHIFQCVINAVYHNMLLFVLFILVMRVNDIFWILRTDYCDERMAVFTTNVGTYINNNGPDFSLSNHVTCIFL